jgi:hypothetical protein
MSFCFRHNSGWFLNGWANVGFSWRTRLHILCASARTCLWWSVFRSVQLPRSNEISLIPRFMATVACHASGLHPATGSHPQHPPLAGKITTSNKCVQPASKTLTVAQLAKIYPAVYWTRRFVIEFTRVPRCDLSRARFISPKFKKIIEIRCNNIPF